MGKVSSKEKVYKRNKRRRQLQNSSSRYLKPGTLAQLRYNKSSTAKSCADFGKKRVAILNSGKTEDNLVPEDKLYDKSPMMLSPVNLVKQNNLLSTPRTPRVEDYQSESRLESLPTELLVYTCLVHFSLCFLFNFKACFYNISIIFPLLSFLI